MIEAKNIMADTSSKDLERQTQLLFLIFCGVTVFFNEKFNLIGETNNQVAYVALAVLLCICILRPNIFVPFTKLWLKLGLLLHVLISPFILVFIYFSIFCTISGVRRLTKVRHINWANNSDQSSYWIYSDNSEQNFDRQF